MMRAGLTSETYDREYSNAELFRRLWRYFAPSQGRLIGISALVTVQSLLGALSPVLVARGIGLLDDTPEQQAVIAALLIAGVVAIGFFNWLINWVRRRQTARLFGDVILALRKDTFSAVMNHDMSFFDKFQSGRITSRITSDTDEFGRTAVLVTEVVSQLLLVVVLYIYLLYINWLLSLILLVLLPAAAFTATAFRGWARRITRRSQQAVADVNVSIQEAVTGIRVSKNFRREQKIYDEFLAVNRGSYDIHVKRGFVLSSVFPTLQFLNGVGYGVLLYAGGYATLAGAISAGAWALFINSLNSFWFPMTNLSAFWSQIQSALSATERIFALIDAEPAVRQQAPLAAPAIRGDIRFEHVGFQYGERDRVLQDFSLHIRPGESVALVGHTGAGKSSIAKLVTRFYEFQAGSLHIDGHDIRSLDLQSYRRQLGIVSQTPFLFTGSVTENIRYARPELDDAGVERIAREIGGGDWIETLPDGLATDVGERGNRLSLGQRQLVVLARLLAQNPAIFILDEATASVDPFTEAQIQAALEMILSSRTSIMIAHRLSTVKRADRILVLERGRIIEEGSHEQLMALNGHYAELYNTYFRHQSLEYIEQRKAPEAVGRAGTRSAGA